MKVAITGTTGCIGSLLVKSFPEAIKLSRKSFDRYFELGQIPSQDLLNGVDVLIHCAWQTRGVNSAEINIAGTRQLLARAKESDVKQIIFISSLAAFESCPSQHGKDKLIVEKDVLAAYGVVVRPGLVVSRFPMGIFKSLATLGSNLRIQPRLYPKDEVFAVVDQELADAVRKIVEQDIKSEIFSVAFLSPISLSKLVEAALGQFVWQVPVPGKLLLYFLQFLEWCGASFYPGSDSLRSLLGQPKKELVEPAGFPIRFGDPLKYLLRFNKQNILLREQEHGRNVISNRPKQWFWQGEANRLRADHREEILFRELGNLGRVLELGCGGGEYSKRFAKYNAQTFCLLDISSELLRITKEIVPLSSAVVASCEELPFADNSFDFIYGSSILHHLELEVVLNECFRILLPGGRIAFAEPNLLNPQIFFQKKIQSLKLLAGDLEHESACSRFGAIKVAGKSGYININCKPFDFVHPAIPKVFLPTVKKLNKILEQTPFVREIAGSWCLTGSKPK